MHWLVGFVIGVLICVLIYFVWMFVFPNKTEDTDPNNPNNPTFQKTFPWQSNPPPLSMATMPQQTQRTSLGRWAPPPPAYYARPQLPPPPPSPPPPHPRRIDVPSENQPKKARTAQWTMRNQDEMDDRTDSNRIVIDEDEAVDVPIPEIEEYNEIRTFDIQGIPYLATNLGLRNVIGAELVNAVIPKGEYTIDSTEQSFTINDNPVTLTIGDYNIVDLAAEIQDQVRNYSGYGGSTFLVSYDAVTSTITFSDTATSFSGEFNTNLAYTLGFASTTFTSAVDGGTNTVTGPNRVDVFGNRMVQVRTAEFNAPDAHHLGIMQTIYVGNEITHWENTNHPELTWRKFRTRRSVDTLTLSVKTRHPSQSEESDYKELDLNGVHMSLTICFRCQRYKHGITDKTLELVS